MRHPRTTARLILALALVAGPLAAPAQELPAWGLVEELVLAAAGISLDQAIALAERRFGARVVRAETREEQGRVVYVLRLLSESKAWTVRVDAASGAIL